MFFHCAEICTNGAKTTVDKAAGALAEIKAVPPNSASSYYILHHHRLAVKKKKKKKRMFFIKQ